MLVNVPFVTHVRFRQKNKIAALEFNILLFNLKTKVVGKTKQNILKSIYFQKQYTILCII